MAGGKFVNHIAKWNGSSWTALGQGFLGTPLALALSGSKLYAAGSFTAAGGNPANHIAFWDGSSWSALGSGLFGPSGPAGSARAVAVSGSDLYVGGGFTWAGGKVSAYLARAYLRPLPALSVRRSASDVVVSWPSADTARFALEQAGTLDASANWVSNTASVTDDGASKSVTLPATDSAQFFRLRRP
jgi:hypothetical protein